MVPPEFKVPIEVAAGETFGADPQAFDVVIGHIRQIWLKWVGKEKHRGNNKMAEFL